MAFLFSSNQNKSKFTEELPAPKRISTPAGLRLSTILENGDNQVKSPTRPKRLSLNRPPVLVEDPREGSSTPSQGYSYSVFSDKSAHAVSSPARLNSLKSNVTRRGGWKRLVLFVGVGVLALTALVVGLAVGLTYQHKLEYVVLLEALKCIQLTCAPQIEIHQVEALPLEMTPLHQEDQAHR